MLDGIAVWNRALRHPPTQCAPVVIALESTRTNRVANALEHDVTNGHYGDALDAAVTALGCCQWRHTMWNRRQRRPVF